MASGDAAAGGSLVVNNTHCRYKVGFAGCWLLACGLGGPYIHIQAKKNKHGKRTWKSELGVQEPEVSRVALHGCLHCRRGSSMLPLAPLPPSSSSAPLLGPVYTNAPLRPAPKAAAADASSSALCVEPTAGAASRRGRLAKTRPTKVPILDTATAATYVVPQGWCLSNLGLRASAGSRLSPAAR